jgi:hypothetical protein
MLTLNPTSQTKELQTMQRVKVLFGLLVALMAVGFATSAVASAAEFGALPVVKFSSTIAASSFQSKNGLQLKSAKGKASGEFTNDTNGKFDALFEEVTGPLGCTATSLDSTEGSGSILVHGTFVVVFLLTGAVGIAFKIEPVHEECAGVLSLITGCAVGTTTTAKSKVSTVTLKQTKGVNEFTDYSLTLGGAMVECILLTSTAGGKAEQSGQQSTQTNTVAGGGESEIMEP